MSKFVLKNIESVKGKQQFKQLIVVSNDVDAVKLQSKIDKQEANNENVEEEGEFDTYENEIEEKYRSSLRGIIAVMDRVANMHSVGENKFKDITPHGESIKEFEFKFQDLRVYAIKAPDGKIVMLGGYKNNQRSDIKKFKALKSQYLGYIKKIKK